MKYQNSKKFTPTTFLAIAIGMLLALTDDYIIKYLGNRPIVGILFIGVLLISLFTMVKRDKVRKVKS
ncbi:MAG: hypothetical protein AB8F94_23580 [Saprospiraceae bacterium]